MLSSAINLVVSLLLSSVFVQNIDGQVQSPAPIDLTQASLEDLMNITGSVNQHGGGGGRHRKRMNQAPVACDLEGERSYKEHSRADSSWARTTQDSPPSVRHGRSSAWPIVS